jgi:hypothetical protein
VYAETGDDTLLEAAIRLSSEMVATFPGSPHSTNG